MKNNNFYYSSSEITNTLLSYPSSDSQSNRVCYRIDLNNYSSKDVWLDIGYITYVSSQTNAKDEEGCGYYYKYSM